MGYYFRTYETVLSKAENPTLVPIIPGRYLICKDTGDIFYDTNDGTRKHLTDIVDIETESARAELLAPLNKFYFVKETSHFWRYTDGSWVDLTPNYDTEFVSTILSANGWTNRTQKITISGLGQNQNGIISLAQDISLTALKAAQKGSLRLIEQSQNALTVTADGIVPTVDIPVIVILMPSNGGNYKTQSKTVTPTKQQQQVTPGDGYFALSDVTVDAIPDNYQDVGGVTATAGDVLTGKKIVGADGSEVTGAMADNGDVSATMDGLTTTSVNVKKGYTSGGTISLTNAIEEALAEV